MVTAATLLVSGALTQVDGGRQLGQPGYLAVCAQWLILAALGLYAAGTLHRVLAVRGEGKPQPYAEATRLLTQLRTVARQLPGATLDPGGISEHLLEELRTVARADRGAVLSASGGGRLVVLAQAGVDRVDWETTLDADSAIADAWASQQAADRRPVAVPLAPRRRRVRAGRSAGRRGAHGRAGGAGGRRRAARTRRRWCPG